MLRRLLIGFLVIAGSLVLAVPAEAVLSGRNGRIVFTSGRGGPAGDDSQAHLYLRPVTGSSGGGLVSAPILPGVGGQFRHPSWSPDRTKIVFANGTPGTPQNELYDLYVYDFVTQQLTALDVAQIVDDLSSDHPAWSPDGTKIAYEHQTVDNSDQRDIMVKTVGTSAAAVNLTNSPTQIEFKPAWSPDSGTIYYAKKRGSPDFLDIVKRPAAGGTETNAVAISGTDQYQPSIAPDGSKICWTEQSPNDSSTAEIFVAGLPGLTNLINISNDNTKGDINCTWSPDGRFIAYVSGTFSAGALVMKKADGTSVLPVPLEDAANHFDGNPDWAPDGSPDCPDSAATTIQNTPITIPLECTDTGPLYERTDPNGFVANDGAPLNGTTSDDAPLANPSTVKYTPNPGFVGTDRIVFTSFDDFGFGTDRGTVTIDVQSNAPTATASGARCSGKAATIVGTPGRDTLRGTPGRDVIAGLGGKDTLVGRGGNDIICGAGGHNRLFGGPGKDSLIGGPRSDLIAGGQGGDVLIGRGGNDLLSGGPGSDKLKGGGGTDRCKGGGGPDKGKGCEKGIV